MLLGNCVVNFPTRLPNGTSCWSYCTKGRVSGKADAQRTPTYDIIRSASIVDVGRQHKAQRDIHPRWTMAGGRIWRGNVRHWAENRKSGVEAKGTRSVNDGAG